MSELCFSVYMCKNFLDVLVVMSSDSIESMKSNHAIALLSWESFGDQMILLFLSLLIVMQYLI